MSREQVLCVLNSVHWYEAIFRTHGLSWSVAHGMWTSRGSPPPYYSNAVAMARSGIAAQVGTLKELKSALRQPTWSVKDSFSILDLAPLGLRPLFDAEWIWRDPLLSAPDSGPHEEEWRRVTTPSGLEQWEAAWRENGSPADTRVFLPELLANRTMAFFAAHRRDAIVAGCAANRSAEAVGFSNFFAADRDVDRFTARAVGEVLGFAAGLPVVGYERGEALERVRRLGFRTVGPLRIWVSGA